MMLSGIGPDWVFLAMPAHLLESLGSGKGGRDLFTSGHCSQCWFGRQWRMLQGMPLQSGSGRNP